MAADEIGAEDQAAHHQLEMTVRIDPGERPVLRSLAVTGGVARLRVSFQRDLTLAEAFRPEVVPEIESLCTEVAPREGVVSLPELRLSHPGVRVEGCTLLARIAADGARHVIIRIRRIMGNALALLRRELLPAADAIESRREQLASLTVEKLFLPVANLNHLLDDVLDTATLRRPEMVIHALERLRAHTLSLQATIAEMVAGDDPRARLLLAVPAGTPRIDRD